METFKDKKISLLEDQRFQNAMNYFNSEDWYCAHDSFEELWHESIGIERNILQGILQVAVAQLHLERGNKNGATILFGEALGRLNRVGCSDFGLDIRRLCKCIEHRLYSLQNNRDLDLCTIPRLSKNSEGET